MKNFQKFIEDLVQIKQEGKPPVASRRLKMYPLPEPESGRSSKFNRIKRALAIAALVAPPISGAIQNKPHPMGMPEAPPMKEKINETIRRPKKMV